MDVSNLTKIFKAALKEAGLPTSIRLYDLRHSCATLLLQAGENPKVVSERLGHASIVLTLDVYSHVLPDMQRGAADKLEKLLFEEIVPTVESRVDKAAEFARQTLERFKNPFLDHKFADIALHHDSKVQIRLVPTAQEYLEKFGKKPALLAEVLGN